MDKKQAEVIEKQFKQDTFALAENTGRFISEFYPSYISSIDDIPKIMQKDSIKLLNSFTFYKLCECTVHNIEDKLEYFSERMEKLFVTAYAIKQTVCYGIVSVNGVTSLLLGIAPTSDNEAIKLVIEGLLPGIKIVKYDGGFESKKDNETSAEKKQMETYKSRYLGTISGIPSLKIDGEFQYKDISSLMRSLNGQEYTIMVFCRPIDEYIIQDKIDEAIAIQDACFAISKRTVGYQYGISQGNTHSDFSSDVDGTQENEHKGVNINGGLAGAASGAAAGAIVGSVVPGIGTAVGAIGGGLIGLIAGKQVSFNRGKSTGKSHSTTKGYSDAVSETISNNQSISGEIQNGFAIELMKMAEALVERLKTGRSRGMWETVVSFSSDDKLAADIIQGSLYSEIASGRPDVLPPVVFSYEDKGSKDHKPEHLIIPKGIFINNDANPLCSLVTSEELCGLCTIPTDNTVGFTINNAKSFSLNSIMSEGDMPIGNVSEYSRELTNVPFGLSKKDINKHVFVCGMTGYGKTNTVKKIIESFKEVPYLVIEPAKKEYRNLEDSVSVYTFGRPEINCIRLNPFYIMPGVSPQRHIDLLKDLFSASFAFYGPMPYIFEKCINRIYIKKGWNLTLGFHPLLINSMAKNNEDLFSEDEIKSRYKISSHKYLFPTMQDLKSELASYIDNELTYEGDVKGNIKSAIESRIDSLCIGSKGFMFNTNDVVDFEQLLKSKAVIELEGLADDSDKAFALGLLIIYINEYRQTEKDVSVSDGLKHILVVEEAHRLLKNVSSEHGEDLGNPKGKSVEHFTNLLAEMRSYGQGVIVAEQIPSKLAPDVIKNSSVKIVHRIAAKDDQEIIANTIGLSPDDVLSIGINGVGSALCHKDGMVEPVNVKISEVASKNVTDIKLYTANLKEKLEDITCSIIKGSLPEYVDAWAVKILVSLMYHPQEQCIQQGLSDTRDMFDRLLKSRAVTMIPNVDKALCVKRCLYEAIVSLMITGVFSTTNLPDEELSTRLLAVLKLPNTTNLTALSQMLEQLYAKKPEKKAIETVAALVSGEYSEGYNVTAISQDFLLLKNDEFSSEIKLFLERGR